MVRLVKPNKKNIERHLRGAAWFGDTFEMRRLQKDIAHQREKALVTTKCAVVVHLYYLDNWPLFCHKLKQLSSHMNFDLYITKSQSNHAVDKLVKADFPDATVIGFKNRGRDVLPFIQVAKYLSTQHYAYVLKFHSKKSTHWSGGQKWLEETLDRLFPHSSSTAQELKQVLESTDTGIVGPAGYFYSLTVNFPANGIHISRVIKRLFGKQVEYNVAQLRRGEYGFFAGTMFWARLDAIIPLLNISKRHMFEPERGQIDTTYAHALERLFCVVPEINQKKIYTVDGHKIARCLNNEGTIPEWSTDHNK